MRGEERGRRILGWGLRGAMFFFIFVCRLRTCLRVRDSALARWFWTRDRFEVCVCGFANREGKRGCGDEGHEREDGWWRGMG
ncbi:hypothetical protein TRSC58_07574 [Trypanosoma rangeli SC58]|uniref:Uncharacterized protein n=1 Tax=Trypanosoma rangeli SC58 TaxID=429131 RepID=A0A061ISW4_TRYRA|nr:hypothetical protein TRSC58_07574 [Trypanosoma rangeli SC58]